MSESSVTLFDPEDVAVVRVEGYQFKDGVDRIRVTYTVAFDGERMPVEVYSRIDDFGSFIVALLNGYGFPEGDLEYIAERLMHTLHAEATASEAT